MGKTIAVRRPDLTSAQLRAAATKAKNVAAERRMLCLARGSQWKRLKTRTRTILERDES